MRWDLPNPAISSNEKNSFIFSDLIPLNLISPCLDEKPINTALSGSLMEELIIIGVCLILNAILAGAEMAFVTVPKSHLKHLRKSGDTRASKTLELRKHPERTLSVIQIGITLVGAIGAAVGGAGAEETINPILRNRYGLSENAAEFIAIALIVLPLTYLNVVIGELVPKSIALRNPARLILRNVGWLYLFDRVLSPFVTFLEKSTSLFMKLLPGRSSQAEDMPQSGNTVDLDLLSNPTRQYVVNLVNIEKKHVKDVMLPWNQVILVRSEQPANEVEKLILSSGHTRLPVMQEGKLVGLINTKEFMTLRALSAENWASVIRSIVTVQGGDSLMKALRQMQEKRSHLSAVYSGKDLVGILTMEDILEEVIGDIFDEDDDGKLRRILSAAATLRTISQRAE